MQAAVLRVKLSYLDDWNRLRKQLASRYFEGLHSLPLNFPDWDGGDDHCFHLFVIASEARDELIHHLAKYGIETSIHYPVPLHLQEPFIESSVASCPQAEWAAKSVLSLPLYPELKEEEQELVIQGIRDFYR